VAVYRKIYVHIWLDADFRKLSQDSKFTWIYLLTGPHTINFPGLFSLSEMTIVGEFNWTLERVNDCLNELELVKAGRTPMLVYDRDSHVMFLPSAIKYTQPENPNVAKGWGKSLSKVPECDLKNNAISRACETLSKGFVKPFQEGLGKLFSKPLDKPLPQPSRNQEARSKKH